MPIDSVMDSLDEAAEERMEKVLDKIDELIEHAKNIDGVEDKAWQRAWKLGCMSGLKEFKGWFEGEGVK